MRVVMGSRTSPPAVATSSKLTPRPLKDIKKETHEDEIKEYAETAMNELLGWYGYDKVDRSDTQGLNLHHFASQRSPPSDLDSSDDSSSPGRRDVGTGSSRDSPTPADAVTVPPGCTVCAWCTKVVSNKQLFSVKTPNGHKAFCSEICFSQCRRANFKRNKTCDWCRHIRHTVNYVDFQDGEHQLQFCSDKCLNQYKMNIFCRETQAHLQMHPHLQDGGPSTGPGSGNLITPDLWLRDCRSDSPDSDRSNSPARSPSSPRPPRVRTPSPLPVEPSPSDRKLRLRRTSRRRIPATITSSTPTDLRTSCSSPRSGDENFASKAHLQPLPSSSLMPPILHPPPQHLFHPDRPPFLPHGMLPHPHLFSEQARYPLLRPHLRPSSPPNHMRPLMTMPPNLPPPRPPFGFQHPPPRNLLPPVTIMVPYPVIIPVPVPIPIPIPIFTQRSKFFTEEKEKGPETAEEKKEEGPVAAFLRVTAPTVPEVPEPKPKPGPRQPLRKRKRMTDSSNEEDAIGKRAFVPV